MSSQVQVKNEGLTRNPAKFRKAHLRWTKFTLTLTFSVKLAILIDDEVEVLACLRVAAGVEEVFEGDGTLVGLADVDGGTTPDASEPISELEGVGKGGTEEDQEDVLR